MTKALYTRVARLEAAALPDTSAISPEFRAHMMAIMDRLEELFEADDSGLQKTLSPCGNHWMLRPIPGYQYQTRWDKISAFCHRYVDGQLTDADRQVVAQLPPDADDIVRGISQANRMCDGQPGSC